MSSYQLNFRLGERVCASEARAKTAALLDGYDPERVGALMNYVRKESGEGVAAPRFPAVRFCSLSDGFSLVGFGPEGADVVAGLTPEIARAWSAHRAAPVRMDSRLIAIGAEFIPYAKNYVVPRMVVQKKPRHFAALQDPVAGRKHVEALFLRGIEAQASYLGVNLPKGITVEFVGCEKLFRADLGHGGAKLCGMKDAAFKANVDLSGLWSVGFIQAKGYGMFNGDWSKAISDDA